ncbi:MAG: class B sortase [Candidatus Coprovivens sp.]
MKKLILNLILLILLILLIYSSSKIISYQKDSNNIKEELTFINDNTIINETENNNTSIIENNNIKEEDPYWDYININLIDVNFNKLKKINNDTVGWIQVSGTNINYPFVQTNNNNYYLNHSFNKNNNSAGWVFLDYRNNLSNIEEHNTIIYAHGRYDSTMFGSLRNILTNDWLKDPTNHIIKLSTEYENTLWQVFSVYKIPTTSDYLKITFKTNEEYIKFINLIKNRSHYNFNTTVNNNDRILTLSTCYNKKEKIVLHAKLIKKEMK